MKRSLAVAVLIALAAPARADDWKAPEDGVLEEKHVEDYAKFLEELGKAGGKWHDRTYSVRTKAEQRALDESQIPRSEVIWARPQVEAIALALIVQGAKPEQLAALEKRAQGRLDAALEKIKAIAKHGPEDLNRLDAVLTESREAERAASKASVDCLVSKAAISVAERDLAKAPQEEQEKLRLAIEDQRRRYILAQDMLLDAVRRIDKAERARLEIVDKVEKGGAREGLEQANRAAHARLDLEEIAAAKKGDAAAALEKFSKKSVEAVKAKRERLEKALRGVGAPLVAPEK